jgi:hypothetical protein
MEQALLVQAVTDQLDALETYFNAIILLAVAAAWSGFRRARELEAFGLKFDRRHAFWIFGCAYLVANVAALIFFLRLDDLLRLIEGKHFVEAFTRLAVHPWVLNPLSFFGSNEISARIHSSGGWGLLVLTWWICNTSLATLMEAPQLLVQVEAARSLRMAGTLLGIAVGVSFFLGVNRLQQKTMRRTAG